MTRTRPLRPKVGTLDALRLIAMGPMTAAPLVEEGEASACSAYQLRVAPCQDSGLSHHREAEEIYVVTEGELVALVGGEEHRLGPGGFVYVPPGVLHGFRTGEVPVVILCFQTPRVDRDHDMYLSPTTVRHGGGS